MEIKRWLRKELVAAPAAVLVIALWWLAVLADWIHPPPDLLWRFEPVSISFAVYGMWEVYLLWAAAAALAAGALYGTYRAIAYLTRPRGIVSGKAEIKLSTSRFGDPIARGYGLFALGAKIIWRGQIAEVITSASGSSKARQPDNQIHRYFSSVGVMVCENLNLGSQLKGVARIWFDGALIYDYGTVGYWPPDGTQPPQVGNAGGGIEYVGGAREFQILLGLPTQLPWHLYMQDATTQHPGTDPGSGVYAPINGNGGNGNGGPGPSYGLVSAHRQKLTLWWDFLKLEPYYNRFPSSILVEVQTVDTTLADVVRRECELVGIQDDELDLTQLADIPIDGITVASPISPKDLFDRLGQAFSFAIIEVDGKLKGIKLPQTTEYDIPLEDMAAYMGAVEDSPKGSDTGQADASGNSSGGGDDPRGTAAVPYGNALPIRVEVSYFNRARLYEPGMQWYGRQAAIVPGGNQDVTRVDLPITCDDNAANEIAKRILSVAWAENQSYRFTLPPKYLYLAPGDLVMLHIPGRDTRARITRMNFGVNDVIEIDAVRQVAEAWNQTGVGSTGLFKRADQGDETALAGGAATVVNLPTRLFLGVVPAFVDADDDNDAITVAACRAATPEPPADNTTYQWTGYDLFRNYAGIAGDGGPGEPEYLAVSVPTVEATMGESVTSLPGWTGAFEGVDTVNYVDVLIYAGKTIDALSDELFNSTRYNGLILIGREILQFRDAEPAPGFTTNVWRLSNLRRGLRGTHLITATHGVAERVLLYNPISVGRMRINQDEYGKAFAYRAVTKNLDFTTTTPVIYTAPAD